MLADERMRPEKSEVQRLWCNNEKLKKLTGFEPAYALRSGLQRTIDWFLIPANLKKYKENIYNV
jgi:nucleoside-diphosphate-sugar epimerase